MLVYKHRCAVIRGNWGMKKRNMNYEMVPWSGTLMSTPAARGREKKTKKLEPRRESWFKNKMTKQNNSNLTVLLHAGV